MTLKEQQDYLEGLNEQKGQNLVGLEASGYRRAMEAAQGAVRARQALVTARTEVQRIEQAIQQLDGRYQACIDLLLEAEQDRRAAETDRMSDEIESRAVPAQLRKLDEPVEQNA
jgi:hypothetical protein